MVFVCICALPKGHGYGGELKRGKGQEFLLLFAMYETAHFSIAMSTQSAIKL